MVKSLAFLFLFAAASQAGTVTVLSSENDFFAIYPDIFPPGSYGIVPLYFGEVPMLSFTTQVALSGLTIQARIFTESQDDPTSATAYLTTSIGQDLSNNPTTVAQEIARATVAIPYVYLDPSALPPLYDQVTIFSGIYLDPGTYYLTLGTQDFNFFDWQAAAISDSDQASYQGFYIASSCECGGFIDPAYPPNSYVGPQGFINNAISLDMTVTADAPEPSTVLLGLAGLAALLAIKKLTATQLAGS